MKTTLNGSSGFTALSLLMPFVLLCLQSGCTTHPSTASTLRRLQGTWEGHELGKRPSVGFGKGQTVEFTMTIAGNSLRFEWPNSTNWYGAAFTLPAQTNPQRLRATINGGAETNFIGTVLRSIIRVEDNILTLASASGGLDEDPPKSFTDKKYPNYLCYEFRKVQTPRQNAESSPSK